MRRRFERVLALGATLAIATLSGSTSAYADLLHIDESGISPFKDGDTPRIGTLILTDGPDPQNDHTKLGPGNTESDILVFKGNTVIVYQSDGTLNETETFTPPADVTSFTNERPLNFYFLAESAANASGFERMTYTPQFVGVSGNGPDPGFMQGSDFKPVTYDIVSDGPSVAGPSSNPEPSALVLALTACVIALPYAWRRGCLNRQN